MKRFFNDVILFRPTVYADERGMFFQSFDKTISDVIKQEFVQDNHSVSHKNVIRGMHYQWDSPMGKLIRVVKGSVMDYFVDIRENSATYGQYNCVELNTINNNIIWIPPGFAHGFASLENNTTVVYRCTSYYNKSGESGINPFDEALGIEWPFDISKTIISEKDLSSQLLKEYSKDIKFN
tara:strand:- start:6916 stop:7455 length:540 start_codon:yes stop_codon:yes gene_type:complete